MSIESKVKEILEQGTKSLNRDALIVPIAKDYPFSSNGVYFFVGRMGTGKTYEIWRHIITTELLSMNFIPKRKSYPNGRHKCYYSLIIYCSTSASLDKTTEALSSKIKGKIVFLTESELMPYLKKHLKWKMKYYAIIKFVLSKFRNANDEMLRLIAKHNVTKRREALNYVATKLAKYDTTDYPYRTLLILDDFAGSPLLKKVDSELARILTKTRHYNLTCIIIAQTCRFISLNIRRLATDAIVFSKFSENDFMQILQQFPNNMDYKDAYQQYKRLTAPHSRFVMNMTADKYVFVND
jgi:hypothetical protein